MNCIDSYLGCPRPWLRSTNQDPPEESVTKTSAVRRRRRNVCQILFLISRTHLADRLLHGQRLLLGNPVAIYTSHWRGSPSGSCQSADDWSVLVEAAAAATPLRPQQPSALSVFLQIRLRCFGVGRVVETDASGQRQSFRIKGDLIPKIKRSRVSKRATQCWRNDLIYCGNPNRK